MRTSEAKVVTIPIKKYMWGHTVYWTGCPSKVKKWVMIKQNQGMVDLMPFPQSPRAQMANLEELSVLGVSFTNRNNAKITKLLPMEFWNLAIKENMVNDPERTGIVTYELVNKNNYEIRNFEPLPEISQAEFNKIADLMPFLKQHSNQQMVKRTCIKFLMDMES